MTTPSAADDAVVDAYRREWAAVLAATVRVCRDLDVAEECVQEAFVSALDAWSRQGVPGNPAAWLTTTAKRKALDQVRRDATLRAKLPLLIEPAGEESMTNVESAPVVDDDRLRLVFTCCHPAIASDTQVALTLRLVCGVPTADIARVFLVSESTMAARITRGKKKIQVARIPFAMPRAEDLGERLDSVLTVVHLLFTAGHTASSGHDLVDREVTVRALELGRLLARLMPGEREVIGLLALMLMTDARRDARVDDAGDLVLMAEQDRTRWHQQEVVEGRGWAAIALADTGEHGRFALQSAIAAVHMGTESEDQTDWPLIVSLYDDLYAVWPTPVVALNRAAAIAMAEGPDAGLAALDVVVTDPSVKGYHYVPATKADLLRRLDRHEEAAEQYRQALLHVGNDVERRFLQRRLAEVSTPTR